MNIKSAVSVGASSYNTAVLPSGLRVIHLPSASPVVYCGYAIAAGTRHEEPGKEGLAHFCEHATFKGTERRCSRKIISSLEIVGGDLNAFTNKEQTVYHAAILNDKVDRAIDLLSDIVFHSTYPSIEIEKEKEVICDEIESYNDSPAELIYDEFENIIFGGHPLGHNILGSAEIIRQFTSDDARKFTQQHYRPSNAVFFAYGDVDFKRLLRLLDKAVVGASSLLSDAEGKLPLRAEGAIIPPYTPTERTVEKHTHQTHVMLGCRAYAFDDDRRIVLYLLNNILGGPAMSARLNLALRERHGLVYTAESLMTCYEDTGAWSLYFGCDPHDVERCLKLVRRELDRFILNPLSPSQLAAAKRQIKGQIAIADDARESFAINFARTYLRTGRLKDNAKFFASIDAITAEDIQRVASELFVPDNLTRLIYR